MNSNQQQDIWDRQPRETAKAYAAFRAYLDAGPGRELRAVYREFSGNFQVIQASGQWRGWYEQNDWRKRSAAYDKMLIDREEAARAEADKADAEQWAARRREIRERDFRLAERALERMEVMLDWPLSQERELVSEERNEDGTTTIQYITITEPAKWTVRDWAPLLKAVSDVRRLSAEMETSRQTLQNPDGSAINAGRVSGKEVAERLKKALLVADPERRQALLSAAAKLGAGVRELTDLLELEADEAA